MRWCPYTSPYRNIELRPDDISYLCLDGRPPELHAIQFISMNGGFLLPPISRHLCRPLHHPTIGLALSSSTMRPSWLILNPRYLTSERQKWHLSGHKVSPASVNRLIVFSSQYRWSLKSSMTTITSFKYAKTYGLISDVMTLSISLWKLLRLTFLAKWYLMVRFIQIYRRDITT